MQFKIKFNLSNQHIPVSFRQSSQNIPVDFSHIQKVTDKDNVEIYDGAYEITPAVEAQSAPTAQKFLTEDMRINAIPFFNVSNTSGGSTVYIGNEVE